MAKHHEISVYYLLFIIFYFLFESSCYLYSKEKCIFFDKRDLSLMSHTAIAPKFKMRWFPKNAIELESFKQKKFSTSYAFL